MNIIKTALLGVVGCVAFSVSAQSPIEISSVSPLPGSTVKQFNYTTIVLSDPIEPTALRTRGKIYYDVRNFTPGSIAETGYTLQATLTRAGEIRIGFTEDVAADLMEQGRWPLTEAGIYSIHIPANCLQISDEDGNRYVNPEEIVYEYNVIPAVDYTVSPSGEGDIAKIENNIILTFNKFTKVNLTSDFKARLSSPSTQIALGTPQVQENVLVIPVPEEVVDPATYTFTLAQGSVELTDSEILGDQINPEINITYNVVGISKPILTSYRPKPGIIESLTSVTLIYNMPPNRNPDCTETLKLYRNDMLILEYDNKSTLVQYAMDNDDPNLVSYQFTKDIKKIYKTSGVYRLEVPEGFMRFNNGVEMVYSEAFSAEYIIPKKFDYAIDPLPGTYTELETFTLTFPEVAEITANELVPDEEGNGVIKLIVYSGEEDLEPDMVIEGNRVTFTVPKATLAGKYDLSIPYGAFTLTDATGFSVDSQSITVSYSIPGFPLPVTTPPTGEVENLNYVTFTLTEGLTFNKWYTNPSLYPCSEKGELDSRIAIYKRVDDDDVNGKTSIECVACSADGSSVANLDLNPGLYVVKTQRSGYTINAPEDSPYNSGYVNIDGFYYYTVVPAVNTEIIAEYDEGYEFTGKLEKFNIAFPKASTVEVAGGKGTLADADGFVMSNAISIESATSTEGPAFSVNINPGVEMNGMYLISLPAGMFICDGHKSPEYTFHYGVTGGQTAVESVAISDNLNIYSIDGKVVGRGMNNDSLRLLPAGIYIVNGKKVLVRK